MVFHPPNIDQFIFKGIQTSSRFPLILAMNAKRLLDSGCTSYLTSIVNLSVEKKLKTEDVLVVQDFLELFPEELPGWPPERD